MTDHENELDRLRRQKEAMKELLEFIVAESACTGSNDDWTCLALQNKGQRVNVCPKCRAAAFLALSTEE